jgi:cell wall-associated NlpC family hydrolase
MPLSAQQSRMKVDEPVGPLARLSASALSLRDSLVEFTKRQIGTPYRRGASSPESGFDCSGLAKYVMEHFNIELPRTSRQQAKVGQALARDVRVLRPGDLLTFGKGKRISHIGIYIGDGKYVHAPAPGARVREGSLLSGGVSKWWKGARRMVALTDSMSGTDSLSN